MVTKFIVRSAETGQRLDRLLAKRHAGLGRNVLRCLFETESVWVDGKPAKKSRIVRAGEQVFFRLPQTAEAEPDPSIALDVLLETPELAVVNKPAGLPSVAARGKPRANMAAALLARYPEMKNLGHPTEAGLVHRLDTPTSGLMLAARTVEAHRALVDARKRGLIRREYWAIVSPGFLPARGLISEPLMPDPKNRRKVRVARGKDLRRARPVQTEFELVRIGSMAYGEHEADSECALLRIFAPRAYRHQIRAHLSSLASPIVNDTLYGGKAVPEFPCMIFLHSCYVACSAAAVAPFEVRCELPSSFESLLSGRG